MEKQSQSHISNEYIEEVSCFFFNQYLPIFIRTPINKRASALNIYRITLKQFDIRYFYFGFRDLSVNYELKVLVYGTMYVKQAIAIKTTQNGKSDLSFPKKSIPPKEQNVTMTNMVLDICTCRGNLSSKGLKTSDPITMLMGKAIAMMVELYPQPILLK